MAQLTDVSVGAVPGDDANKQIESIVKQTNEALRLISNEDRTKIIKDDAGVQRLLTGYQENGFSNGNVGVKLSQEGVDVLDASGDELIFSTDFNTFKIAQTGNLTIPTYSFDSGGAQYGQASSSIVSEDHSLSIIPAVVAYWNDTVSTNGYVLLPYELTAAFATSGICRFGITVYTDSSKVYASSYAWGYNQATTIPALTVKYYLLQETAA